MSLYAKLAVASGEPLNPSAATTTQGSESDCMHLDTKVTEFFQLLRTNLRWKDA